MAFHFDIQFWVLFVMACVSLMVALSLHLKSQSLRKLPKNPTVNVFNKTFNVYDPHPKHGIIHSQLAIMPILILFLVFFIGFVALMTFETSVFLGIALFLLCLNSMMVEETHETFTTANLFIRAVRERADFGKGDLQVLFLVKHATLRLTVYFALLAGAFFAFSIALPYVEPVALLYFAQLFSVPMQSSSYIGIAAPYLTVFLFTVFFMTAFFVGGRLKTKIFSFPSAVPLTSIEEQFETVKIMAHWAETPPYEWSHRTIEEDPVILERKMRELRREEED